MTENNKSIVQSGDVIKYWDEYYKNVSSGSVQSSFAEYCLQFIKEGSLLLELGCGDGRDSFFFAKNNISVIATDISNVVLQNNTKRVNPILKNRLQFLNADFTNFRKNQFNEPFSTIYSRFTFHTIIKEKVHTILKWCFDSLHEGGLLLVETRSINDPLCSSGIGTKIDKNTFVYEDGHLRHFIKLDTLRDQLIKAGFSLIEVTESNNLSVVGDDNPVLIRVVAKK